MKTITFLSLASGLALLTGCCGIDSRFQTGTPRLEVTAIRAPGAVNIDGVIDGKEWAGAPVHQMSEPHREIPENTPPKARKNYFADPFEGAKVRLMYDDKYLYISADLTDSDVVQYQDQEQSHFYLCGDTLEIFIKPENSPEYWECFATPNGKRTTLYYETRHMPYNPKKSFLQEGMRVGVKVHGTLNNYRDKDKGWTIEVAFPLEMLEKTGVKFVPEEPWTILIARYNYNYGTMESNPFFSTCPDLPQINYHLTEYYAKLIRK